MLGTYVLYTIFFGLSAFMLYAFTQYGKPVQIEVGPVTFGGTPFDPPVPSRAVQRIPERTDHPRVIRHGSVTIRAAAGARIVIG